MATTDPDEHPASRRAAGWAIHGWVDFGFLGALWVTGVAIWARAGHRHHRQGT